MDRMATRRKPLRKLLIEPLENRALLTAEGQSFALDRTVDCSDLATDISAMVNWGDGTTSPGTIQSAPLPGALKFRIDYSMDSSGFFADADRRAILQTTADLLSAKFSDSLLAIQPKLATPGSRRCPIQRLEPTSRKRIYPSPQTRSWYSSDLETFPMAKVG